MSQKLRLYVIQNDRDGRFFVRCDRFGRIIWTHDVEAAAWYTEAKAVETDEHIAIVRNAPSTSIVRGDYQLPPHF